MGEGETLESSLEDKTTTYLARKWVCDYCIKRFLSYHETCEHEMAEHLAEIQHDMATLIQSTVRQWRSRRRQANWTTAQACVSAGKGYKKKGTFNSTCANCGMEKKDH